MLMPKKKLTRREIKQDKLVTAWFKVSDYIAQHSRELLLALAGIIVVIGMVAWYNYRASQDDQNASGEFVRARSEYTKQNYSEAIKILESLIGEYNGTKSAGMAKLYLANAYMQTKDFANAEKYYSKYLDEEGNKSILSIAAAAGLAATQEERGNYAQAGTMYETAASDYEKSYRAPELLMRAGQCFKLAGDSQNAHRVLKKLVDKHPKSELVEDAKMLMAEAGKTN
jgi:predicted negative regulator of RcsB-dependent stress response